MALVDHPHVFQYDGRLWVSALPGTEARAQLVEQRRWDAGQLKSQRWVLAIALGAAVGVAVTLGLGTLVGIAPAAHLVLLPLGFGAGAVLGAVVNKRMLGAALTDPPVTPRPETTPLTRIPSAVARKTDENTPVEDLIAWSAQGFVPRSDSP